MRARHRQRRGPSPSARIAAALVLAASSAMAFPEGPLGPLTVGIVADADSFPLVVAAEEGLFAAEGADVRLIRFASEADRNAALQAEAIDAAATDLVSLILSGRAGLELRAASLTDGRYGIASAPGSGIASLSMLGGASLAVSIGTIDEYVASSLLARAGFRPGYCAMTPIFGAEERLRSLLSGKVAAACLPEPYLSRAAAGGAALLASTSGTDLETGVLAFRKEVLDGNLDEVAALYRAYRTAARLINENSSKYRGLLVSGAGYPEAIRDSYNFVVYKRPRLPTPGEMSAVADWLAAAGLMPQDLDPQALLDDRALRLAFGGW